MGGLTSFELPELAYLGVRVFITPIVSTLWNTNKTNTGWAIALAYSLFFAAITVAFDLRDPLTTILRNLGLIAFKDAVFIYFGVFSIVILLGTWLGAYISMRFGIRELLPINALLPSYETHNLYIGTKCSPVNIEALRAFYCMCAKGLTNGCYSFIDTPWLHTIVTFILYLITVTLADFIFWYFAPSQKWAAYFSTLGIRLVGYLLAWAFWSYFTDLYVWGPTEYNTRARRDSVRKNKDTSPYIYDPNIDEFDTALFAETQSIINRNVAVIALIDIMGTLLVGGVIVVPSTPSIKVVIGVGSAYLALVLIIVVIFSIFIQRGTSIDQICNRCPKTGLYLNAIKPRPPTSSLLGAKKEQTTDTKSVYTNTNTGIRARPHTNDSIIPLDAM